MSDLNKIENSQEIEKKSTEPKVKPLKNTDEIEVISLVPNVYYTDKKTGDEYEWEKSEQIEKMEFSAIKEMWRSYKTYFKNYWLKPLDNRVIKELGLSKLYEDYDFVMDEASYTKENIDSICQKYRKAPNQLKPSICNRIKVLVTDGKINNVKIIKTLEKTLNVDLFDLIKD